MNIDFPPPCIQGLVRKELHLEYFPQHIYMGLLPDT